MAEYAILPFTLDLRFIRGDEFNMALDFEQSLVSYSLYTQIYEVASVSAGVPTKGPTLTTFTIDPVDLSLGKINLSLTETQTESFNLAKSYRWWLRWVSPGVVTRTILSGTISVGDP